MPVHADAQDIARRIVPPLVTAFVLFLVVLRYAVRHPEPEGGDVRARIGVPWPVFWRWLAITIVSGYAAFLLIVLVFHVALARDAGAFRSAVAGGAVLAFGVAVPVFVVSEILARRGRR
jgi:hypothetical protein